MRLAAILAILTAAVTTTLLAAPPTRKPAPPVIHTLPKVAPEVAAQRGKTAFEAKDYTAAVADLALACAGGIAESCFLQGEALRRSVPGPVDPAAILLAYRQACEKGFAQGCQSYSVYHTPLARDDAEKAQDTAMLARGCELESGISCASLGYRYEKGLLTAPDPVKARQFYLKGCELKNPAGCRNTAVAFYNGVGGDKDPAQALAYNQRACDLGHVEACYWAADQIQDGDGTTPDRLKARALFGENCTRNDARSCAQYGYLLEQKLLPDEKRDRKAARAAYEKACRLGSSVGCGNLGIMQEWGSGGPPDLAGAFASYDKSCEMRLASSCAALSRLYRAGQGTVANPSLAAIYLRRACDLGDARSCKTLGR